MMHGTYNVKPDVVFSVTPDIRTRSGVVIPQQKEFASTISNQGLGDGVGFSLVA